MPLIADVCGPYSCFTSVDCAVPCYLNSNSSTSRRLYAISDERDEMDIHGTTRISVHEAAQFFLFFLFWGGDMYVYVRWVAGKTRDKPVIMYTLIHQ